MRQRSRFGHLLGIDSVKGSDLRVSLYSWWGKLKYNTQSVVYCDLIFWK